jgi:predicted transcriptional regulator
MQTSGGGRMKSVLISIRPKWTEKIARGEKTIEVRKTTPKEVPFKCYIYCTKEKKQDDIIWAGIFGDRGKWNGRVIGEFICDRIICSQAYFDSQGKNHLTNVFPDDIKKTCLDEYDLWDYIAGKAVKANQMYDGYLWHISDLKIYDKPKELGDFKKHCHYKDRNSYCLANECEYYSDWTGICCNWVERPPQSWCYVEDLGEEK